VIAIKGMSPSGDIEHHGVKGMHWGIRKDEQTVSRFSGPSIEPGLHESTVAAANHVSALMHDRYGFEITKVVAMGPGNPEYDRGTMGFVENKGKKAEGVINITIDDTRPAMKKCEKVKWVGKGCGTPEAFLTHETAHAMFHATSYHDKNGNIAGGNIEARLKAGRAAFEQAAKDGIRNDYQFMRKLSGYALHGNNREEVEAELFSQYHWGTNPPKFVKVWGETLHREMGIDGTPFRKGV